MPFLNICFAFREIFKFVTITILFCSKSKLDDEQFCMVKKELQAHQSYYL